MTLDELDHALPNGFHDADILSLELDYVAATAKLHLSLLVGWPEDPDPERQAYQEAMLIIAGLCFCSIEPPSPAYPFLPDGKPINVSGDPAEPADFPSLPELAAKLPVGSWCYRLELIYSYCGAGRQAYLDWRQTEACDLAIEVDKSRIVGHFNNSSA
jgi:hypothetical protein